MTVFEQTWQQDNNRVPSDQTTVALQSKSMLWYIKAFAKGEIGGATLGLWTCAGSSDAVTAGMDASDRWTAAFDSTKIVRAAGAVAHSWIVLFNSGLGAYLLLDYNTNNDYQVNVYVSKNVFVGGTITARPTSTVEIPYSNVQLTNSSLTPAHMFGLLAEDGDLNIKFGQDGSGQFTFGLAVLALAEPRATETHNIWPVIEYNVGGIWRRTNLNTTSSGVVKGRNFDNTAAVIASLTAAVIAPGTFAQVDIGTFDATDSLYSDAEIRVQVTTVGHKSRRGRLRDIAWAPESLAVGAVESTSGPPYQSVVVGTTFQPYNASVAPML